MPVLLGDPHVILGTIWLKSLDPPHKDFNQRTLKFWRKGKSITLQGVHFGQVDVVEGKVLEKLFQLTGVAYALQCSGSETETSISIYLTDIQILFIEFAGVFELPKSLPPYRQCDYRIPFINPSQTISSRPYYPSTKKVRQKDRSKKC